MILAVTSEHHKVKACHVVRVDNGYDSVLNDQSNVEYSHMIEKIVMAFHDEKHHQVQHGSHGEVVESTTSTPVETSALFVRKLVKRTKGTKVGHASYTNLRFGQ